MNELTCLHCGKPLESKPGQPAKFCSTAHRVAFNRAKNKQSLPQSLAEPEPTTPTKPLQTQADLDQQALEDYRRSPAYKSRFPPNTTFLPFNHTVPHFRGLAIPDGFNPEAYLPIQPKHFHNAKNQPHLTIQSIKDSLTKPL